MLFTNAASTLIRITMLIMYRFNLNQVDGQQNTNSGEGQQISADVSNKAEAKLNRRC